MPCTTGVWENSEKVDRFHYDVFRFRQTGVAGPAVMRLDLPCVLVYVPCLPVHVPRYRRPLLVTVYDDPRNESGTTPGSAIPGMS